MSRYDLSGGDEREFEPGTDGRILSNKLGITDAREMDLAEARAYQSLTMDSLEAFESDQRITVKFIKEMHRQWLGDIYNFAGEYRTVNVSKGGLMFCASPYIESEMKRYEEVLKRCTPCDQMDKARLSAAMAEVHGEFILIHPFREGNGRLGRWITTLMAVQMGYPLLSFDLEGRNDQARLLYFSAVRRFAIDPTELTSFFSGVLDRTTSP